MNGATEGRGPSGSLFRRREFLTLGSAGLLSLCFGDFAWAQSVAGEAAGVRPLPVGYLEGSGEIPDLRHLAAWIRQPQIRTGASWDDGEAIRIVPATQLPLGDTNLIGRPLRVTIHGLYPPSALVRKRRAELPLAIDLDVLFPSPDPALHPAPLRFYAWSFRRRPGWNPSPPVSFTYPLDWHALPEIAVRVVQPGGAQPVGLRTRFTFDDEAGMPKLQRGIYLLGTVPEVWRSAASVAALARTAPVELVSLLVSIDSAEEQTD